MKNVLPPCTTSTQFAVFRMFSQSLLICILLELMGKAILSTFELTEVFSLFEPKGSS